jgi:molybdenum cofactor biosynthesis enzyme MoaA
VSALFPQAPLLTLDTLYLQVAGTLCNLACTHCFIESSPTNRSHEMMALGQVRQVLAEARGIGVRETYLTGGEPFLHRDILAIVEACLELGPCTVLTNGVLIREATARRLRELFEAAESSLDLRISLDGWDAASNDPVRGAGSFERILAGIRTLAEAGLNPVITVTEIEPGLRAAESRDRFLAFLREVGLARPRLKLLPLLRIGAEPRRTRGYTEWETLRGLSLTTSDVQALVCGTGRAVTARGVYVCPILIEDPRARLGARLAEALGPFELRSPACHTCHVEGLSCRT